MRQGIRTDTFSDRTSDYRYHSGIVFTNSLLLMAHRFDHRCDRRLDLVLCLTQFEVLVAVWRTSIQVWGYHQQQS